MDAFGNLNNESVARLDFAADSETRRKSQLILLCGWPYREDSDVAIADAMYSYLKAKSSALSTRAACQRISRDTVGDSLFSRLYLDINLAGVDIDLEVFTSDYHVERTAEIFKFFFAGRSSISVFGVSGFSTPQTYRREADSLSSFRNTFCGVNAGDIVASYAALQEKHPYYNGSKYPVLPDLAIIKKDLTESF